MRADQRARNSASSGLGVAGRITLPLMDPAWTTGPFTWPLTPLLTLLVTSRPSPMFQKVREGATTLNRLMLIHAWLAWYAEKTPGGLLFVGERGKPFRRSTFGREWRKARSVVGLPADVRFYDLRHTGHTLTTRLGATLKDTVVRVGQSTDRAARIYQHSDSERQREVASGLDSLMQAERRKAAAKADEQASGTERARDT